MARQQEIVVDASVAIKWFSREESGTSGIITRTCVDTSHDIYGILWCQHYGNYQSAQGDSGSPVYFYSPPLVQIFGIHWGSDPDTGERIYSPIENVEIDQRGRFNVGGGF